MTVLVLGEHDGSHLKKSTLQTLTAAQAIHPDVTLLIVGPDADKVAPHAAKYAGIKKVLVNPSENYAHGAAENIAALIVHLAPTYTHIMTSASSDGKNIFPRVAALLDVAQISDVLAVLSPDTFTRPMYAGNIIATVQSKDAIKVITVRGTAFPPTKLTDEKAAIEMLTLSFHSERVEFVSENLNISARPELTAARIIVAGGRGLQNAENFHTLLGPLADKLHAAIGASRAAVDAGFVDNAYQVGQTGKIVAPELYIAIGISGAIQHLAGMKEAKIIVAINKDADAEMMKIADFALQADLLTAIPELIAKL